MSKIKTIMVGAALTTALSGGAMALGGSASATTTGATTTATSVSGYQTHPRCHWHTRHYGWHHKHGYGRYVNKVRVHIDLQRNKVKYVHRRGCLKVKTNHGHW
jgi:hypothetical protein